MIAWGGVEEGKLRATQWQEQEAAEKLALFKLKAKYYFKITWIGFFPLVAEV